MVNYMRRKEKIEFANGKIDIRKQAIEQNAKTMCAKIVEKMVAPMLLARSPNEYAENVT